LLYIDPKLDNYILEHISPEGEILEELTRQTNLKTVHPQMNSGHLQGKILEIISKIMRPHRILEIGTFTGYSAISLAKGLDHGGKLFSIDISDELYDMAISYIEKAGMKDKITLITGNALEVMKEMDEYFDLVFMDGEKREYSDYYDIVINMLKPGGVILADNVLWSGKVIDSDSSQDPSTLGILAFNKKVREDDRVECIILPVRDGISVIRKKWMV